MGRPQPSNREVVASGSIVGADNGHGMSCLGCDQADSQVGVVVHPQVQTVFWRVIHEE
jgi:hypothetical protein